MLPCLTDPFYPPVNDILTIAEAISVYFFFPPQQPLKLHYTYMWWKRFESLKSRGPTWRYCLAIWVAEHLKLPGCCLLIRAVLLHWLSTKCWQLRISYGHISEDTLFLLFHIMKRRQLGNPEWKSPVARLANESYAVAKNRWWLDGEEFWHKSSHFLMRSFVVLERLRQMSPRLCFEWP